MVVDAIVRVSFNNKNSSASNSTADALSSGDIFGHTGTSAYVAHSKPVNDVLNAINALMNVVNKHQSDLDFLSISIAQVPSKAAPSGGI